MCGQSGHSNEALMSGRANGLDVRLTVTREDTTGNCQGQIEAEVFNMTQANLSW